MINRYNATFVKIQTIFLQKWKNWSQSSYGNTKDLVKTILKENKVGGLTLFDFKTSYKAIVITLVQTSITPCPDTNLLTHWESFSKQQPVTFKKQNSKGFFFPVLKSAKASHCTPCASSQNHTQCGSCLPLTSWPSLCSSAASLPYLPFLKLAKFIHTSGTLNYCCSLLI